MTKMDWFNIITGIAGICGALSWIPIVLDKIKQREVKASLIHCRFFDRFSYPILPPDYVGQQLNSKDVTFDKYEGALIVVGINICSTNKDFVVDKVKAVLSMDKSEIEAILVSPDVILPYLSNQDNAVTARFYIPSSMDISKMKNIHANVNTRLYMAFICKDVNEIKYEFKIIVNQIKSMLKEHDKVGLVYLFSDRQMRYLEKDFKKIDDFTIDDFVKLHYRTIYWFNK